MSAQSGFGLFPHEGSDAVLINYRTAPASPAPGLIPGRAGGSALTLLLSQEELQDGEGSFLQGKGLSGDF